MIEYMYDRSGKKIYNIIKDNNDCYNMITLTVKNNNQQKIKDAYNKINDLYKEMFCLERDTDKILKQYLGKENFDNETKDIESVIA